jgi:Protein of unknown function (DUF3109)
MDEQILPVGNILVRREIAEIHFKCDLLKCKGACCTFESRYGAPITWDEINQINQVLSTVIKSLPKAHKSEIEENGFFEVKKDEPLLRSIDNRACVFVYYDDGIAKCAMEKAYFEGKTDFRKPISCHLFPIRISDFGGDVLRFEHLDECQPAIELGKNDNTTVAEFCGESLSRKYGEAWYSQFKELIGK